MAATMTCNECGASVTGTVAEALAWDALHDTQCPNTPKEKS